MLSATLISSASVIQLDALQAVTLMVFVLLYCPCMSTIGVLKKEIGAKYTLFSVLVQLATAYAACLCIFNIGLVFRRFGAGAAVLSAFAAVIIFVCVLYTIKKTAKKRTCKSCNYCNKCL
jgi:ferrous iron transport protein B